MAAAKNKSEKRRRTKLTAHRWHLAEFNLAASRANDAGLSFGAYVRAAATGDAGPRAQRRAPVDTALLAKAIGLLGKYGSNLNQIAHQLNANPQHGYVRDFQRALQEWDEIRDALLAVTGKNPDPPVPP